MEVYSIMKVCDQCNKRKSNSDFRHNGETVSTCKECRRVVRVKVEVVEEVLEQVTKPTVQVEEVYPLSWLDKVKAKLVY